MCGKVLNNQEYRDEVETKIPE